MPLLYVCGTVQRKEWASAGPVRAVSYIHTFKLTPGTQLITESMTNVTTEWIQAYGMHMRVGVLRKRMSMLSTGLTISR
jgi:hypothetical protein